jgi:hypothetical protein
MKAEKASLDLTNIFLKKQWPNYIILLTTFANCFFIFSYVMHTAAESAIRVREVIRFGRYRQL